MNSIEKNILKNEKHYDIKYQGINIDEIMNKIRNVNFFLKDATKIDTSWVGLYYGNFQESIKGKRILELGCGDCTNLAVMAALGGEVYGNDISQKSGIIINKLNLLFPFKKPMKFVEGDFLNSQLKENYFDIIIGKAFIHHLTNEQELLFTKKMVKYLKHDGVVRYFEPAVNSNLLDELRWLIPVPGRPSKLQKNKFLKWKEMDPHPERDNSSNHYEKIGKKFFYKTKIVPIGSIERFCRLIPSKWNRPFRKLSYKIEFFLPYTLNRKFARSQLIEYKYPKTQDDNVRL
tara:strand:+ start:384 stop:1250 length:867 start_codon:yes stop_codon:yes gene_type:complete